MSQDDAGSHLMRLYGLLDEAAGILIEHGESHWSTWLTTCRRELQDHDAHGLDRLFGGFGGMGSFNDLLVLSANGHNIDRAQEESVNRRLDELRDGIWTVATAIRDESRGR